jgi:alkylation response protein AidB-like acyl-CoA dehydrogenase
VFNGRKSFSTGSKVSDVTVLEGVLEGTNTHVFAIVPSNQPGLTFHDDWDNIGQRLTESGSVTITEVQVPWSDAAHYTRTRTRPWLHRGHNKAVDEPYILDTYSDLAAKLWAVEALADQVADEALAIHRDPGAVTERARGDHEVRVAAVKARATDVALEITGRIFEVTVPARPRRRWAWTGTGATSAHIRCTTRLPTSGWRSGPSYCAMRFPNRPGTPDRSRWPVVAWPIGHRTFAAALGSCIWYLSLERSCHCVTAASDR